MLSNLQKSKSLGPQRNFSTGKGSRKLRHLLYCICLFQRNGVKLWQRHEDSGYSAQDIDEGNECGISVDGFDAWEAGDEARCFIVKLVSPELVAKAKK